MLFLGSTADLLAARVTQQDIAWREAVILSGVPENSLVRPAVRWFDATADVQGYEIAEYDPERNEIVFNHPGVVGSYCLLIHQYLHAIHHQSQRVRLARATLSARDEAETWVTTRMGWRGRSNACSTIADPHMPLHGSGLCEDRVAASSFAGGK
jgi:hypothetical protein